MALVDTKALAAKVSGKTVEQIEVESIFCLNVLEHHIVDTFQDMGEKYVTGYCSVNNFPSDCCCCCTENYSKTDLHAGCSSGGNESDYLHNWQ